MAELGRTLGNPKANVAQYHREKGEAMRLDRLTSVWQDLDTDLAKVKQQKVDETERQNGASASPQT